MLKQITVRLLVAGAALLGAVAPASAQQTVNLTLGYATLLGQSSRTGADCAACEDQDVLVAERRFLSFEVGDFNSFAVGGEWLVPLGEFVEAGAGITFAQRTVPSLYTAYTNANGREIEQEHVLRRLPVDLTVRLLPLGQTSPVQPYIGGGLTLINWRYRETGEFIDFAGGGRTVYCVGPDAGCDSTPSAYESSGTETGPVILGGVRFAGDTFAGGGEVRYHRASGPLIRIDADGTPVRDFEGLANKIDLGGWSYQATIGVRFGR